MRERRCPKCAGVICDSENDCPKCARPMTFGQLSKLAKAAEKARKASK